MEANFQNSCKSEVKRKEVWICILLTKWLLELQEYRNKNQPLLVIYIPF